MQRVAAYAVIVREDQILLSRLSPHLTDKELWTLPGGGLEHGEDPRDAVVREVHEETGLDVRIGETAHVYSMHQKNTWRHGRRADAHSLRIVYDGWVPVDAPEPRVVEVDGSTVDAAWHPVQDVLEGRLPVVSLVTEVLERHRPFRLQRVAAYALLERSVPEPAVLLTRISRRGHHTGAWTLPGGGVEHGEDPREALVREVAEETGLVCKVGGPLEVHHTHFGGTAPSGRHEDFHGIHLVFEAQVADDVEPSLRELDGTTDAAAWVSLAAVDAGEIEVLDVVRAALAARRAGSPGAPGAP